MSGAADKFAKPRVPAIRARYATEPGRIAA